MDQSQNHPRHISFELGQVVGTPGALEALQRNGQTPQELLDRHRIGDWGDVCPADARANDDAVANESDPERQNRVLSAYKTKDNETIWVITEADRASTCLLLPSEY